MCEKSNWEIIWTIQITCPRISIAYCRDNMEFAQKSQNTWLNNRSCRDCRPLKPGVNLSEKSCWRATNNLHMSRKALYLSQILHGEDFYFGWNNIPFTMVSKTYDRHGKNMTPYFHSIAVPSGTLMRQLASANWKGFNDKLHDSCMTSHTNGHQTAMKV